jgi:hypothetical protein
LLLLVDLDHHLLAARQEIVFGEGVAIGDLVELMAAGECTPLCSRMSPTTAHPSAPVSGVGPATHAFATCCIKRRDGVDGCDNPGTIPAKGGSSLYKNWCVQRSPLNRQPRVATEHRRKRAFRKRMEQAGLARRG